MGVRFAAGPVGWYNPGMARDLGSGRPLLDKLGVRFGAAALLLDWEDDVGFIELLGERTDGIALAGNDALPEAAGPSSGFDLVFLRVRVPTDLNRIAGLKKLIKPNGAIWVVRDKGKARTIGDTDVIHAGLAAGLVDNKIASFSDTLAAMRLVIRLRDR